MPVQIPYPYFELEFDAKGKPTDATQLPALIDGLRKNKITDLFIISHGWNNDEKDAHALYQELFTNVKAQEKNTNAAGRSFAVAGVIWPSKKFDAAEDKPNAASLGAASSTPAALRPGAPSPGTGSSSTPRRNGGDTLGNGGRPSRTSSNAVSSP